MFLDSLQPWLARVIRNNFLFGAAMVAITVSSMATVWLVLTR